MKTGMTKKAARNKLKELRKRLQERGKEPRDIDIKPVGFDTLDDDIGYSLSINLAKPLDEYHGEERRQVRTLFIQVGLNAASALGLCNVRTEDFLWKNNSSNVKSAAHFQLLKVHGEYPIEKEVFVDGHREKRKLMIPVEIQILPVETLLRTRMPGDVSTDEYERKKARELAQRNHPITIAGVDVYPEAFSVGRLADVMNRTVEEVPTSEEL